MKGKTVHIGQIKEQLKEYEKIQGQYISISEKNKQAIDNICKKLFNEYLGIEYEIKLSKGSKTSYEIQIGSDYDDSAAYSSIKDYVSKTIKTYTIYK